MILNYMILYIYIYMAYTKSHHLTVPRLMAAERFPVASPRPWNFWWVEEVWRWRLVPEATGADWNYNHG